MFNILDFDPNDSEALATYKALKEANDEQNAKQEALREKIEALIDTPNSKKLKGEIVELQDEVKQAQGATQEKVLEHLLKIQENANGDES